MRKPSAHPTADSSNSTQPNASNSRPATSISTSATTVDASTTSSDASATQLAHPRTGSIGRIIAILAVISAFVLLFVLSLSMKQNPADRVWDSAMTVGSSEPEKIYVMYTDIACPYCDVFSRAALEHWDEFLAYLDYHKIVFEIRLTDMLYAGNKIKMSRDSAEAAYCAKREGKFWEYYHGALMALWNDYHSKGMGSSKTAAPITGMPDDYWLAIGHKIGLGTTFDNCVHNRESADEVVAVTAKAAPFTDGMPTFQFGSFHTAGFNDLWGWDEVKLFLDSGLR